MVSWPKPFQNLRSSCETRWIKDGERADLVENWIGHSVKVQRKNYLQHTEEDIESFYRRTGFVVVKKATQKPPERGGTRIQKRRITASEACWKPNIFVGEMNPQTTPSRTRTCNIRFRRAVLYPVELSGRGGVRDAARYGLQRGSLADLAF